MSLLKYFVNLNWTQRWVQAFNSLMHKPDLVRIEKLLRGLPHMTLQQAERITAIVVENKYENILELGFQHGVSTCYMAEALSFLKKGHITTIDLSRAQIENPNLNQLLQLTNLTHFVTPYFEPTSYLWRLMKMLEESPGPIFDFCYIDGAHSWFVDGFAFFLVDRLLKPGGMIVFDDLDWSFSRSPALGGTDLVKGMPIDEKETAQIRKVYELLVKTHPDYFDFIEIDGWALARKKGSALPHFSQPERREVIYRTNHIGLGTAVLSISQRLYRLLKWKIWKSF